MIWLQHWRFLSRTLPHFSSNFHREEYGKLFDFVNAKKLNIKNRGFKEVSGFGCAMLSHWCVFYFLGVFLRPVLLWWVLTKALSVRHHPILLPPGTWRRRSVWGWRTAVGGRGGNTCLHALWVWLCSLPGSPKGFGSSVRRRSFWGRGGCGGECEMGGAAYSGANLGDGVLFWAFTILKSVVAFCLSFCLFYFIHT